MESIKKLFVISRPISWLNTAYPFAAGYVVNGGAIDAHLIIGTVFFLIPYNVLLYGVNDVFDYESDIRNPRKGGIEGAVTAKRFHPIIMRSAVLSTLPFVLYLLLTGLFWSDVVLLIVLFFVVAYSLPRLRFKERPLLDSLTSSIHFVGPLVFALSLTGFQPSAWPFVIAFLLWGMASHAFGAIQDIIPDREGSLASIATELGARPTLWLVAILYSLSVLITGLQGRWAIVVAITGIAYVANSLRYVRVTDQTSTLTRPGWRRFIWLNYLTGFVVTIVLILQLLHR